MSALSATYMHDEAAAFAHVEAMLWANGPVCPHCGVVGNAYELNGVRSKPSKKNPEGVDRHGLKKCKDCGKQFTVRVNTIFESSHVKLHLWLQAIYLMTSSKKGISSHQLHRTLGVTVKTAWFMSHRIREAMRNDNTVDFGSGGGTVEVAAIKKPEMRPYRELGSVEGLVKTVGRDGYGRPIVTITTRLDGQDVKCIASDAGLDKIAHLAVSKVIRGLRVRIHGVLFYKTPAFLGHIEVDRTELFLAEDELPNIDELIDKEFTGGLSSVEFIKQVRADV
jgi:transposase-like protein